MKNFFKDKWNPILLTLGVLLVVEMAYVIALPPKPCVVTLDVTKGQNFDQPILTRHHCAEGEVPSNIDNFLLKEER